MRSHGVGPWRRWALQRGLRRGSFKRLLDGPNERKENATINADLLIPYSGGAYSAAVKPHHVCPFFMTTERIALVLHFRGIEKPEVNEDHRVFKLRALPSPRESVDI